MDIAVISGKGGTGKTTVAVAITELLEKCIMIDCDVDAPNFYLYNDGKMLQKTYFYSGKKAVVNENLCIACGECGDRCNFDAINNGVVNEYLCEGCGMCELVCPYNAIKLVDEKSADVYISDTDKGILSHAKMEIGSEGSGKLITELRKKARNYNNGELVNVIDGSPGIGCAVIASITGCDKVLAVTESTKSGLNDLLRVLDLCEHFNVPAVVCINKHDLNDDVTNEIERECAQRDIEVVGKIPYDDTVMKSVKELKPIIEYGDSSAGKAIIKMFDKLDLKN